MSVRTTNFGPRVSFTTTLADAGPVHVLVDSDSTFETAGTVTLGGTVSSTGTFDASAGAFLPKQNSASLTSLTLADGELSIGSVSVTSATIYFRSGVTIYQFDAQAAGVL